MGWDAIPCMPTEKVSKVPVICTSTPPSSSLEVPKTQTIFLPPKIQTIFPSPKSQTISSFSQHHKPIKIACLPSVTVEHNPSHQIKNKVRGSRQAPSGLANMRTTISSTCRASPEPHGPTAGTTSGSMVDPSTSGRASATERPTSSASSALLKDSPALGMEHNRPPALGSVTVAPKHVITNSDCSPTLGKEPAMFIPAHGLAQPPALGLVQPHASASMPMLANPPVSLKDSPALGMEQHKPPALGLDLPSAAMHQPPALGSAKLMPSATMHQPPALGSAMPLPSIATAKPSQPGSGAPALGLDLLPATPFVCHPECSEKKSGTGTNFWGHFKGVPRNSSFQVRKYPK